MAKPPVSCRCSRTHPEINALMCCSFSKLSLAIFKVYVRPMSGDIPHKILPYMVQYLHFRILEFPLKLCWAKLVQPPVSWGSTQSFRMSPGKPSSGKWPVPPRGDDVRVCGATAVGCMSQKFKLTIFCNMLYPVIYIYTLISKEV